MLDTSAEEKYITFETAKQLKECGYSFSRDEVLLPRPSQAQAKRWLREEHRIHVSVDMGFYDWHGTDGLHWDYKLIRLGNKRLFFIDVELNAFQSYEEASEAGIKAACEYLIKNQQ